MATIREKGYSHWDGEFLERPRPWWTVTRTGIRLAFRRKWFKFAFTLSLLPAVFFLGLIYASENLEKFRFMIDNRQGLITIGPKSFMEYLSNPGLLFFMILVLLFAGAGLIADDLKHNSLQLYFAHPLTKLDYLAGKMGVVCFFVLICTLGGGLVAFLVKLMFAGSLRFFAEYPWLPLSIVSYSLLLTLFFACYVLLISAMSKNRRFVVILIAMIYYFSDVLERILFDIFRNEYMSLFSLRRNLVQIGSVIFRQKPAFAFPPAWSFLVVACLVIVAIAVLTRRIRGVEVIK